MSTLRMTRRTFVAGTTLVGLVTVAGRGILASPAWAAGVAKVGETAPAFNTAATNGRSVSLADQRGKIVILEWTNHDCPYVRKHYESGNMQTLQKEIPRRAWSGSRSSRRRRGRRATCRRRRRTS